MKSRAANILGFAGGDDHEKEDKRDKVDKRKSKLINYAPLLDSPAATLREVNFRNTTNSHTLKKCSSFVILILIFQSRDREKGEGTLRPQTLSNAGVATYVLFPQNSFSFVPRCTLIHSSFTYKVLLFLLRSLCVSKNPNRLSKL